MAGQKVRMKRRIDNNPIVDQRVRTILRLKSNRNMNNHSSI